MAPYVVGGVALSPALLLAKNTYQKYLIVNFFHDFVVAYCFFYYLAFRLQNIIKPIKINYYEDSC